MNLRLLACRLILGLTVPAALLTLLMPTLNGCAPGSAGVAASNAGPSANKVEQGVLVGVRPAGLSRVSSAAGLISPFSMLGAWPVSVMARSIMQPASTDVRIFEYIVRKPNNDLVSVMQKDKVALVLGQKVMVIAGTQARVVAD